MRPPLLGCRMPMWYAVAFGNRPLPYHQAKYITVGAVPFIEKIIQYYIPYRWMLVLSNLVC